MFFFFFFIFFYSLVGGLVVGREGDKQTKRNIVSRRDRRYRDSGNFYRHMIYSDETKSSRFNDNGTCRIREGRDFTSAFLPIV